MSRAARPGTNAPLLYADQGIPLTAIDIHGGTQTRLKTTDEAVESYADEMAQGTLYPPITVYYDGATHWLADGLRRLYRG